MPRSLTFSDTFPDLVIGGAATGDWVNVRKTSNYQSNGPVTNVQSDQIRCYELNTGSPSNTATVAAGSSVGFTASPDIFHPGPLQVYMALAPGNVSSFDGTGNVWFKIYEDHPSGAAYSWSFPTLSMLPPFPEHGLSNRLNES
jgi:hypothetical protein